MSMTVSRLPNIDLRRGETDAMRSIHGFEHVLDQLMQFGRIEFGDGVGRPFEDWVVQVSDDFISIQKSLTCSM